MKKKYVWIAGWLCSFPLFVGAQQVQPLTDSYRLFQDGKELFLRQDYAAAHQVLNKYVKEAKVAKDMDEVDYMLACTAYELRMPDCISRLEEYLENHPESRYRNRVDALIGSAYFFEGKYGEAIAMLKSCDFDGLGDKDREDCIFRLAESYMNIGNLEEARAWFEVLNAVGTRYKTDGVYHMAYIDYVQKRYDAALNGFRKVMNSKQYNRLAPYYIADILLVQGKTGEARQMAADFLEKYPNEEKSGEMHRVAGEAAYQMNDFTTAVEELEAYRSSTEQVSRNAYYALGMSYYQMRVFSKAAACLGEATTLDDAMTQNAYLHRGLAYLELKDRNMARLSFEQAAATDFNMQIKEQALYNYALSIHETSYSPFAESVTVFERFLNEFPNSAYTDKVNDYLIEVYMNTRSYTAALQSIAKISRPGDRILEAKQKLLFRVGTQAFAQAAFENAIEYFSQSLQLGRYNQQTKANAYFWRGESKYRLEQYPQAAADYRQYLEFATDRQSDEYGLALYNLGYTAFKQKQYGTAKTWFDRCIASGAVKDPAVKGDAYNRAGDCYFFARQFDQARQQYANAVSVNAQLGDYSLFQEAFVKGLQKDYLGKVATLNKLLSDYPASQYIDDALYEQGRAFVQQEQTDNAIERYQLLVKRYPDSPLSRKAANEIGLLYYQNDRYNEAIAAYKKVISTYPGSDEARMAQRDLKSVYIDLNKVDDYVAYASTIPGGANFDISERDSLTYVAAERAYMRGDIASAKSSFIHYLQSFPEGAFCVNSSYYLGLIAYNENDFANAAQFLNKVIEYPNSKFSTEAMGLCADMAYKDKDYVKALGFYKQMVDRSSNQEERLRAETGALRSAWLSGDATETITAASSMLAQNKLMPELENEARYYRAKSLVNTGKTAEAMADWKALSTDTRNVYGAEAKYLVAQYLFDQGKTHEAEAEVLKYIEVSTPHAYWLARSFVLLSDVYVKLGRQVDAKQYLLSLKQNYQANDDIAEMIETRLEKLNAQQKAQQGVQQNVQ